MTRDKEGDPINPDSKDDDNWETAGYHRFIDENGNRFGSFLVYHVNQAAATNDYPEGWYWVSQFPGCLPDGDPEGPFPSAACAHDHAIDF